MEALPVIAIIALFGVLAAAAFGIFIYGVVQQRRYNSISLPDLDMGFDLEEEEEELYNFDTGEDEYVPEHRFARSDEELILEDEETNELLRSLAKAADGASKEKKTITRKMFGKKGGN